jgi:hypothetical protein
MKMFEKRGIDDGIEIKIVAVLVQIRGCIVELHFILLLSLMRSHLLLHVV